MWYLDTCVCIEFLRGRLSYGYKFMREANPDDFQLPAIVVAELWFGAEHSTRSEEECRIVGAFIDAFSIAPFDTASAKEYGRIRQTLGSQGSLIGDRDLMIAATALANRATLVTNNVKDFGRVPGLALESWAEIDLA